MSGKTYHILLMAGIALVVAGVLKQLYATYSAPSGSIITFSTQDYLYIGGGAALIIGAAGSGVLHK